VRQRLISFLRKLATRGGIPREEFIRALYTSLLDREPSHNDVTAQVARLDSGLTPAQVAAEIALSDEAQGIAGTRHPYVFAPLGHFSSPVFHPEEVERHYSDNVAFDATQPELPGIVIEREEMLQFLNRISTSFRSLQETTAFDGYDFSNGSYSWGDSITYAGVLSDAKPQQILEIGSGWSTRLAVQVVQALGLEETQITCIEPFPELVNSLVAESSVALIAEPLSRSHVQHAEALQAGDILFVDSTHIAKSGSDVCMEVLRMVPSLRPGVLIHFHDIFWPFEYPHQWNVVEQRGWNEIYLVHALLLSNSRLQIRFFNDWAARFLQADIEQLIPEFMNNSGGSLWLEVVSEEPGPPTQPT